MKILVIQLARFGDIYCTWPSLRALQRTYPESEIHVLVRERFASAMDGFDDVTVHVFPTNFVLEPVASSAKGYLESIQRLGGVCANLRDQSFDFIFNVTFSPFSSYLTQSLLTPTTHAAGYGRFSDGYLAIKDEISAYFYAQVGIGKFSRFHVADMFAQLCGVQLTEADWVFQKSKKLADRKYFAVHLGASQKQKRLDSEQWRKILEEISRHSDRHCILIGSSDEAALAHNIKLSSQVTNLIGKTSIAELFEIIGGAEFLVGADSAPIHIASLTGTPVLNISFQSVNFWETGPRSPGSRILLFDTPEDVSTDIVAKETLALIQGRRPVASQVYVDSERKFISFKALVGDAEWRVIEWIYCGIESDFSIATKRADALLKIFDLNQLCLEHLAHLEKDPQDRTSLQILARADEIFTILRSYDSIADIVVNWFFTEKVRIPPGPIQKVLERTYNCHVGMKNVVSYLLENKVEKGSSNEQNVLDT